MVFLFEMQNVDILIFNRLTQRLVHIEHRLHLIGYMGVVKKSVSQ